MNKSDRHAVILRLVHEREIATQEELAHALRELGYEVVQTTVSRDITELGLVKVRGASGKLVYAAAAGMNGKRRQAQLAEAFRRWALSCEASGNLVVLTTPPGFAGALAQEIDDAQLPRILNTLAGENTILIVAREGVTGAELGEEIRSEFLAGLEIENEMRS
ncbi:MAG: arginine repressor [Gaiellaceae bacterium]|jgi:transcriptional regulator of arginine metabolism